MMLPRRVRGSVYTVCDAEDAFGDDGEAALDRPLHRERREDREQDFDGQLREGRGEGRKAGLDGLPRRESGGDPEPDFEGPPPRRRRRVVAVILPAAAACVAIAIALVLLGPLGGERRPRLGSAQGASRLRLGSAEGASRLHETNVPETNVPAGIATPIGRASRISPQTPAPGGAPAARADVKMAPRRSGRAIEAPRSTVPVGPIILLDAGRPVVPSAGVLAEAEFGFER